MYFSVRQRVEFCVAQHEVYKAVIYASLQLLRQVAVKRRIQNLNYTKALHLQQQQEGITQSI